MGRTNLYGDGNNFKRGPSAVLCKCPKCEQLYDRYIVVDDNRMPRLYCSICRQSLEDVYDYSDLPGEEHSVFAQSFTSSGFGWSSDQPLTSSEGMYDMSSLPK